MDSTPYTRADTALLLIDPYNDFLAEGGKLFGHARTVAEQTGTLADFMPQPGDVLVREHWGASGFANTDLDVQLRQHGLSKIVLIGMLANTCVETTARFGAELGYHVTLVRDATAAFSPEAMHAAHAINGPTYAHAILGSDALVAQLR